MIGASSARAALGGRAALLTYEPYYGLKEKPFSLSADPRFLYKSQAHAPVFDELLAGIRRREGLIVLTGDIGTGKTTLCRAVLEELDRKTFSTFVPDPFVSREDLLKMLLVDFGVVSVDDLKSGRLNGASRPDLSYPLYEFLNSLVPLQAFAVLIIDEAQNLSVPLLEEIRILSDLEAPEKLLQVVLVGQLEFQAKLKLPEMRQVDQRVWVRCNLEPLDRDAVAGYIQHRLMIAGGSTDRLWFPPDAIDLIARTSHGVPRAINLICDRSLHRGHMARTAVIDADIVRAAMIDLGLAAAATPPSIETEMFGPEPQPEAKPEEIVFEEHDLIHADPATEIGPTPDKRVKNPQAQPVEPAANNDRPLLFETRGLWNMQGPASRWRWRWRPRRVMIAVGAVLIVVFASYWQAQWDDDLQSTNAPDPPASPLRISAWVFDPQRVVARVPPPSDVDRPATVLPAKTQDLPAAAPAAVPGAVAPATRGMFAIDVALFHSATRASVLVGELTAAGYGSYVKDIDLGERGHGYEVVVGPLASRAEADASIARIHAMPGYADARIVSPAP